MANLALQSAVTRTTEALRLNQPTDFPPNRCRCRVVRYGHPSVRPVDGSAASTEYSTYRRVTVVTMPPRACISPVVNRRRPRRDTSLTPVPQHAGDRLDDADIAGAAAEIAAELAADARLVDFRQAGDDVAGSGEHP